MTPGASFMQLKSGGTDVASNSEDVVKLVPGGQGGTRPRHPPHSSNCVSPFHLARCLLADPTQQGLTSGESREYGLQSLSPVSRVGSKQRNGRDIKGPRRSGRPGGRGAERSFFVFVFVLIFTSALRRTAQWLDVYIIYEVVLPVSPVPTWHRAQP